MRVTDDVPAEGWCRFVREQRAPIYPTEEWLSFLKCVTGGRFRRWVALRGETIVGGLAAGARHGPLGWVVNALPWYGTPGACVLADRTDDEARQALLAAFRSWADELEAVSTVLVTTPAEEAAAAVYDAMLQPDACDDRIGQVTHLPTRPEADLEAVLATVRQKTRNLIRKAFGQDFRLIEATDESGAWRALETLHADGMRAKGATPKPPTDFEALRRCVPAAGRRIWLTMDGERPAAALLTLHHGDTTEYLVPAVDLEYRSRQALSFVIAHAMVAAMRAGRPVWNWGGTWRSQTSLHHFKRGWGAADATYRYLVRTRPGAVARFRTHRAELTAMYPSFFVYPFGLL